MPYSDVYPQKRESAIFLKSHWMSYRLIYRRSIDNYPIYILTLRDFIGSFNEEYSLLMVDTRDRAEYCTDVIFSEQMH